MKTLLTVVMLVCSSFICWAQTPSFSILSPTSSILTNGTVVTIRWTPPAGVKTVRLMICPDANHCSFITESTTNSGEYTWTVNRQGYDPAYYNSFRIRIDGCTTNYWCGNGESLQFTIIDKPPNKSRLTKIEKLFEDEEYSYFELSGDAEPNFTHYLEYSWDMQEWFQLSDSPITPTNGVLAWYVRTSEPSLFFRVATTY